MKELTELLHDVLREELAWSGAPGAMMAVVNGNETAYVTEGFRDRCGELVRTFRRELGAIRCEELKEKYMVPEVRCLKTLELGNAVVEQCLEKALK